MLSSKDTLRPSLNLGRRNEDMTGWALGHHVISGPQDQGLGIASLPQRVVHALYRYDFNRFCIRNKS